MKQKRKDNKLKITKNEMMVKIETEAEKFQTFKLENIHRKHEKQQKIFSAEQKRADMRNAFYHMAVWNV